MHGMAFRRFKALLLIMLDTRGLSKVTLHSVAHGWREQFLSMRLSVEVHLIGRYYAPHAIALQPSHFAIQSHHSTRRLLSHCHSRWNVTSCTHSSSATFSLSHLVALLLRK